LGKCSRCTRSTICDTTPGCSPLPGSRASGALGPGHLGCHHLASQVYAGPNEHKDILFFVKPILHRYIFTDINEFCYGLIQLSAHCEKYPMIGLYLCCLSRNKKTLSSVQLILEWSEVWKFKFNVRKISCKHFSYEPLQYICISYKKK
jgi:hypothetical protein